MDIQFFDPDDLPRPKAQVRFRGLTVTPYPDGRRVRLELDITPFQDRPNIDVEVFDAQGGEVASLNVIESLDHHFEISVHLRSAAPAGKHTAQAVLFYPDTEFRDQVSADFEIHPST